jgi:hypothetical protein
MCSTTAVPIGFMRLETQTSTFKASQQLRRKVERIYATLPFSTIPMCLFRSVFVNVESF